MGSTLACLFATAGGGIEAPFARFAPILFTMARALAVCGCLLSVLKT